MTPAYVDPTVARGGAPGPASDVFGVAAAAFHALTGVAPWNAATPADILAVAADGYLPDLAELAPEAPAELIAVVLRGLAADPHDRGSAAAFALDLRHACRPEPVRLPSIGMPIDELAITGRRPRTELTHQVPGRHRRAAPVVVEARGDGQGAAGRHRRARRRPRGAHPRRRARRRRAPWPGALGRRLRAPRRSARTAEPRCAPASAPQSTAQSPSPRRTAAGRPGGGPRLGGGVAPPRCRPLRTARGCVRRSRPQTSVPSTPRAPPSGPPTSSTRGISRQPGRRCGGSRRDRRADRDRLDGDRAQLDLIDRWPAHHVIGADGTALRSLPGVPTPPSGWFWCAPPTAGGSRPPNASTGRRLRRRRPPPGAPGPGRVGEGESLVLQDGRHGAARPARWTGRTPRAPARREPGHARAVSAGAPPRRAPW